MNELIFHSIELKNFLSVGNQPLKIEFNRGINFVCGWSHDNASSNGCGKTVIFYSSILYALFGESGRSIKQANLINYYNKSKMYVKLVLEKNYEEIIIYRGRKPNIFYYTYAGVTFQNDNVYETQNQLNKLLDISEDIFSNVFIINASDTIDFIKEEGSVKLRDRFERIFFKEIIFKRILETVRREHSSVQKQIEINNSKMQEKLGFLKRLKSVIESSKKVENYEKQLEKYKKQQELLEHKLMISQDRILQRENSSNFQELQTKKKSCNIQRDETTSQIYYFTQKIKETKEKLKTIMSMSETCPLCRQPINTHTADKLKSEYQTEVESAGVLKQKFEEQKSLCDEELKKIEEIEGKIQTVLNSLKEEQSDTKSAITEVSQQMRFFQENYKDYLSITQEFGSVKEDLLKIRNENATLGTTTGDLELLAQLFDNSAGGILNYFIEKVLKILNGVIAKYIKAMQFDFNFYFDENLRLKFDVFDSLSLNNFSGGEKKIINFIVFFSLIEFFYNTLNFRPSILIIDEIADTAISAPKVELIFQILNKFHKENNVGTYFLSHDYAVEHNSVITFDSIIELEKTQGFTSIKEIKYNKIT